MIGKDIELIEPTPGRQSGYAPEANSAWADDPGVTNDVIRLDEKPGAADIKYQILEMLGREGAIKLDASDVTKISMPVVQIILAAHKQVSASGGAITVRNANFFFLNAFESLGYLGDKEIFQLEYA
jgi:hypothetical protein